MKKPILGIALKFENQDTYDCMNVVVEGYYFKEFTKKIKEELKEIDCIVGKKVYTNKWKIIEEKKFRSNGVGIKL